MIHENGARRVVSPGAGARLLCVLPCDLVGLQERGVDILSGGSRRLLMHYNTTRNHSSLGNRPPISRVRNQLRHDS